MITSKQIIKLRIYEQQPAEVQEKWCSKQQEDFALIIDNVDDLISNAFSASDSQQNYENFMGAKKQFIQDLLNIAENYRYVKEA